MEILSYWKWIEKLNSGPEKDFGYLVSAVTATTRPHCEQEGN